MLASELEDIKSFKTGLFIDRLTGVQGIPFQHITEIFGDAGIGKSTLCLQIVASAQQQGLRCLWMDAEWGFTPRYAQDLGVRCNELELLRERYAEAILDAVEGHLEAKKYDLVILDSIGGLLPRAEAEKESGGKTIGGQAGLIAKFCRKIVPLLSLNNVALIVINHSFVDIMSGKTKTSGGKKLEYHKALSIRLKQKFGVQIKQGDRIVGKVVTGTVWGKNRLAATEGMSLDSHLLFGKGFSASADRFEELLENGEITKEGNGYFYKGEKLAVGKEKARGVFESLAAKSKE